MGKREETERYEASARALYEGRISEGAFLRETAEKWRQTAHFLFSRWRRKLPAWVEPEDVEQELVLLVLKHVRKWSPERGGMTIGSYVLWCAIHRTQRAMDQWRGARDGSKPSRSEIAFSRAFAPDADPLAKLKASGANALQEEAAEAAEVFTSALGGCRTVREALVLLALRRAGGSPALAAALLYGDFAARVECALADEGHARRVVAESVSAIAAREFPEWPALPEDLFAAEDEGTTEGRADVRAA